MDYGKDLDVISRDILAELGNVGTGNAVRAFSDMLDLPMEIRCPQLKILGLEELHTMLGSMEELQTGIQVKTEGTIKGKFLFLLDEVFTEVILDTALEKRQRDLMELNDMERSLICEIGNIMCASYINALAQILDMSINIGVPEVCIDMGGAILVTLLSQYLEHADEILLIENVILMGGKSFQGRILFLPKPDTLDLILGKLKG